MTRASLAKLVGKKGQIAALAAAVKGKLLIQASQAAPISSCKKRAIPAVSVKYSRFPLARPVIRARGKKAQRKPPLGPKRTAMPPLAPLKTGRPAAPKSR